MVRTPSVDQLTAVNSAKQLMIAPEQLVVDHLVFTSSRTCGSLFWILKSSIRSISTPRIVHRSFLWQDRQLRQLPHLTQSFTSLYKQP